MHASSCVWSLSVPWQRWWSHHLIRRSLKSMLHANFMALCFVEPKFLSIKVLYCGNRNSRPYLLLQPWAWPSDLRIRTWPIFPDIYRMCENELRTSRLLKVADRHTDKGTDGSVGIIRVLDGAQLSAVQYSHYGHGRCDADPGIVREFHSVWRVFTLVTMSEQQFHWHVTNILQKNWQPTFAEHKADIHCAYFMQLILCILLLFRLRIQSDGDTLVTNMGTWSTMNLEISRRRVMLRSCDGPMAGACSS